MSVGQLMSAGGKGVSCNSENIRYRTQTGRIQTSCDATSQHEVSVHQLANNSYPRYYYNSQLKGWVGKGTRRFLIIPSSKCFKQRFQNGTLREKVEVLPSTYLAFHFIFTVRIKKRITQ